MQITPRSYLLDKPNTTITPTPTDLTARQQLTLEAKADPTTPNSYNVEHTTKITQPDEPPKRTIVDPTLDKPSYTFLSIASYKAQPPLVDTFV